MTIKSLYTAATEALYAHISHLVETQGVETNLCGTGEKFLSIKDHNLFIGGDAIFFINERICLDRNGHQYNTSTFEHTGELEKLIDVVDEMNAAIELENNDEPENFVFIRGYETEADLDAQRSTLIETITKDEWEDGTGTGVIVDNEAMYFHIEVTNSDGRILNQ